MTEPGWLILGLTLILILPMILSYEKRYHPFLIRTKSIDTRKHPRKRS